MKKSLEKTDFSPNKSKKKVPTYMIIRPYTIIRQVRVLMYFKISIFFFSLDRDICSVLKEAFEQIQILYPTCSRLSCMKASLYVTGTWYTRYPG